MHGSTHFLVTRANQNVENGGGGGEGGGGEGGGGGSSLLQVCMFFNVLEQTQHVTLFSPSAKFHF